MLNWKGVLEWNNEPKVGTVVEVQSGSSALRKILEGGCVGGGVTGEKGKESCNWLKTRKWPDFRILIVIKIGNGSLVSGGSADFINTLIFILLNITKEFLYIIYIRVYYGIKWVENSVSIFFTVCEIIM